MTKSNKIAVKRIAVAVAAVCASLAMPAVAADNKAMLDLMLKKGVITQKDYDEFVNANQDAEENKAFKEKRIDQDLAKANAFLQKNADSGSVMKNGIGIQSADGANSIQLTGRLHMDYRGYTSDATTDPYQNKFDIRRARVGFKGQFMQDWKYEVVATLGGKDANDGLTESTTFVDVAYADYAADPALQFRIGKFKMPFSLEQLTSSNNIDFMERSLAGQVEGEVIPAKETGVMIFGSPMSGLSYGIAASRGRGNKDAISDSPDYIGRIAANVAELTGNKDVVVHLGLGLSTGTIKGSVKPASARTEARDSDKWFEAAALSGQTTRKRTGLESAVAYGPYKAQGEYFMIDYRPSGGASQGINAYYGELLWNITGESHNYSNTANTFGWIKPSKAFTGKGGLGAWQVGLRYSNFDATDFTSLTAGTTNKANATTVGLTWFVNDNVRFMLNYVDTSFGSAVGSGAAARTGEKAVLMRGQVSF